MGLVSPLACAYVVSQPQGLHLGALGIPPVAFGQGASSVLVVVRRLGPPGFLTTHGARSGSPVAFGDQWRDRCDAVGELLAEGAVDELRRVASAE